jgi:dephospho-CoA kinase
VIVLGLTGSIGMGKSVAARMLQRLRVPLFDADLCVHRLLAPGGQAVAAVAAAFPGVESAAGGIDRRHLGARAFADPAALRRLEGILHPLVAAAEARFVARARARRAQVVVLDIPLLFEAGGERRCDYVAVVSASPLLQRERVMRRSQMTEARFAAILRQQMPDSEKRRRADFVVPSGLGRALTRRRLRAILRALGGRRRGRSSPSRVGARRRR